MKINKHICIFVVGVIALSNTSGSTFSQLGQKITPTLQQLSQSVPQSLRTLFSVEQPRASHPPKNYSEDHDTETHNIFGQSFQYLNNRALNDRIHHWNQQQRKTFFDIVDAGKKHLAEKKGPLAYVIHFFKDPNPQELAHARFFESPAYQNAQRKADLAAKHLEQLIIEKAGRSDMNSQESKEVRLELLQAAIQEQLKQREKMEHFLKHYEK